MKNKLLKIVIIFLILSTAVYLVLIKLKIESKIPKDKFLLDHYYSIIMLDIFDSYNDSGLECMKYISEENGFDIDKMNICKWGLNDYISKDTNDLLYYIPVYDSVTKKREAFLLLSAGFDGKINNNFYWTDSLFKYQLKEKLSLYNPIEFNDKFLMESSIQGNYIEYLFGRKDVLIMYMDCFEHYKKEGRGVFNMQYFNDFIKNKRFKEKKVVNLQLTDYEIEEGKIITKANNQFRIEINYVSSKFDSPITINDTVYVTGRFAKIDYDSKYILIENAVIYPASQLGEIPLSW